MYFLQSKVQAATRGVWKIPVLQASTATTTTWVGRYAPSCQAHIFFLRLMVVRGTLFATSLSLLCLDQVTRPCSEMPTGLCGILILELYFDAKLREYNPGNRLHYRIFLTDDYKDEDCLVEFASMFGVSCG